MKQLHVNFSDLLEAALRNQLLYLHRSAITHLHRLRRPNESIHEARLCFKRARAIIRLCRPGLKEEDFVGFDTFYRQCGQSLGQIRDTAALLETIKMIHIGKKSPATNAYLQQLSYSLNKELREWKDSGRLKNAITDTLGLLINFEENIHQLSVVGNAGQVVEAGIRRLYRQGKKRLNGLLLVPNDIAFHRLRKNAKYLGYAFESLQYLYPTWMKSQMSEFTKLGRLLGSHRDLVILLQLLGNNPEGRERNNLRTSIVRRKKNLERRILSDARLVYLWKPTEFARKVEVLMKYREKAE